MKLMKLLAAFAVAVLVAVPIVLPQVLRAQGVPTTPAMDANANPVASQTATSDFNLRVNAGDLNTLSKALSALPYSEVAPLIAKLQQQIATQSSGGK